MASDPTKPLLKFDPGVKASRTRGPKVRIPYPPSHKHGRQKRVLGPKFAALQKALADGQSLLALRADPEALAHEIEPGNGFQRLGEADQGAFLELEYDK